MQLNFTRGVQARPRGHALVYFRGGGPGSEVLATYLVVPPVPLNLAKYMPPMFASGMPMGEMQNVSAVPFPPIPEKVESVSYLERLAEARDDDLIDGGTVDVEDMQRALMATSEAARQYLDLYENYLRSLPAPSAPAEEEESYEVDDVLFSLMSERQRLGELAKLTGKLRYALDGGDTRQVKETVREMEALGKYVPEKY
ncbi:MAG: hypothetical protein ACYC1C_18460, partial [Chloroflexota bacterium]